MAGLFGGGDDEPSPGTYNTLGIGSLMEGVSKGLQTGAQLGLRQQEIDRQNLALQNEAANRQAAMEETRAWHQEMLPKILAQAAAANASAGAKTDMTPAGQSILDEAGNVIGRANGKGGIIPISKFAPASAKSKIKDEGAANAAFTAIDQLGRIGSRFQPKESELGAVVGSPLDLIKSYAKSSNQGLYKDTQGVVGIKAASAIGGRRSDPEIARLEKAAGGLGLSQTDQTERAAMAKQGLREQFGLPRTASERYDQLQQSGKYGNEDGIHEQLRLEGY